MTDNPARKISFDKLIILIVSLVGLLFVLYLLRGVIRHAELNYITARHRVQIAQIVDDNAPTINNVFAPLGLEFNKSQPNSCEFDGAIAWSTDVACWAEVDTPTDSHLVFNDADGKVQQISMRMTELGWKRMSNGQAPRYELRFDKTINGIPCEVWVFSNDSNYIYIPGSLRCQRDYFFFGQPAR